MQHEQVVLASNVSASTTGNVVTLGGKYLFAATATWGGGSVALQYLGPNATLMDLVRAYDVSAAEQNEPINTLKADGALLVEIPPGLYGCTITTATAVYATLTRVPVA